MATVEDKIENAAKSVLQVEKDMSPDRQPRHLVVYMHFDYGEGETADESCHISEGTLETLGVEDAKTVFQQMWDEIPDRSEAVNDAVASKIPDKLWKRIAWKALKAEQMEG